MELLHETVNVVELLRQFRLRAFMEKNVIEESKVLTILVFMMNEVTNLITLVSVPQEMKS